MPATFNWAQTVGALPGTRQDLGSSGNLINFKNTDTIGSSDYGQYPVPAGNNSYEVWLQGHFSGTYAAIYDIRFWMSTPGDFAPANGFTVKSKTDQQTYAVPTNATSSIATSILGTSDPGSANVSYQGSLTSSITTSNAYTDYIVLQLQTTALAPAGDSALATFSMSYIET